MLAYADSLYRIYRVTWPKIGSREFILAKQVRQDQIIDSPQTDSGVRRNLIRLSTTDVDQIVWNQI